MKWLKGCKHDYQRDQWGVRCAKCGSIHTEKGIKREKLFDQFCDWFYGVLSYSFTISGIMVLIFFSPKPDVGNGFSPWNELAFVYLALALAFMYLRLSNEHLVEGNPQCIEDYLKMNKEST